MPAFRQEVQTFRRRRALAPIFARTVWMFGFHRRWVRRCECETDMPKPGPLPQTSHTAATSDTPWNIRREDFPARVAGWAAALHTGDITGDE